MNTKWLELDDTVVMAKPGKGNDNVDRVKKMKQSGRWLLPVFTVSLCLSVYLARYFYTRDTSLWPYSQYFSILFRSTMPLLPISFWVVVDEQRFDRLMQAVRHPFSLSLAMALICLPLLLDIFIDILFFSSFVPLVLGLFMVVSVIKLPLSQESKRKIAESVHRISLVLATLMICLVCMEIFFRSVLLEKMVPDTAEEFQNLFVAHWLHPVIPEKKTGRLRVIGLSDSFGEFGDWNNYHYLLEKEKEGGRQALEVVNFSKGGYAPIDEVNLLERFGASYHPDVVLHGFFVGNDFHTPRHLLHYYMEMDLRPADSYRPRFFLVVQWLQRLRVIWRYKLRLWLENSSQAWGNDNAEEGVADDVVPSALEGKDGEQPEEGTEQYTDILYSQEEFWQIEKNHLENCRRDVGIEKNWEETTDLIDRIRQQTERMGSRYIMVLHPARIQVEDELLNNVQDQYRIDMEKYDRAYPQKFLLSYCRKRKLECLDLLPFFKKEAARHELFLPNDIHYNSKGNQLAASTILNFLRSEGFVGKDRAGQ